MENTTIRKIENIVFITSILVRSGQNPKVGKADAINLLRHDRKGMAVLHIDGHSLTKYNRPRRASE